MAVCIRLPGPLAAPILVVTRSSPWLLRIAVWTAFVVTMWWCGPRAVAVLAARFDQAAQSSPQVELDRVGFVTRPEWVDKPLLVAIAAALSPWLGDSVPILDDAAMRRLRDGLQTVPWVRATKLDRVFPDRLRLDFELRRPVLAVRDSDGVPLCLVDAEAIMLPWVDTPLPVTFLRREGGAPTLAVEPGAVAAEPRVVAAAAIAVEWRDEIAPRVASCPPLLEVDATNLGERFLRHPGYPEIRVRLARSDGAGVTFAYDRPVGSRFDRVPASTKAKVLSGILAAHPGLAGLDAGDLRLSVRWQDYLQPRPSGVRDPFEQWNALLAPGGR